jgi:molecular chaperone GrpE
MSAEPVEGRADADRTMSGKPQAGAGRPGAQDPGRPQPGPAAPKPHPEKKGSELERLKQEAAQAQDRYLRALADFENTKKRLRREQEELARYASETVVRDLLPVMDSLDQALVAVDKQADPQAIIKGVHLIYRQLLGLLDKEGVKRIPAVGEPFDPHRHEAVAQVETTDGTADDTVIEEVQVGYTMHGKVIRPAIVKVAKQSAHSTQQFGGHNG